MYKAMDKWFWGWLRSRAHTKLPKGKKHLLFCVADHYEPFRKENSRIPTPSEAAAEVAAWLDKYRKNLAGFRDSDGRHPCHTFFYPAEEYDSECINSLSGFAEERLGEIEIQLHHRNDTPAGFQAKISSFRDKLSKKHLVLGEDRESNARFGFVHGNWSLCNSRPDGDWCGVNEELALLQKLGCYADFTFPSAPSPTQPPMINCIYRACDTPGRPRGCDNGVPAQVGTSEEQGLMLIPGPLGIRWQGARPRLENGALTSANPPTSARLKHWISSGIGVRGRPDWIFVKIHMHGLTELNGKLLSDGLPAMHRALQQEYNDGSHWSLHYASAREMYNIARAAESGKEGNPNDWRDFVIRRPKGIK